MIDQLPNGSGGGQCPPFKGALTACHPNERDCSPRKLMRVLKAMAHVLARAKNYRDGNKGERSARRATVTVKSRYLGASPCSERIHLPFH